MTDLHYVSLTDQRILLLASTDGTFGQMAVSSNRKVTLSGSVPPVRSGLKQTYARQGAGRRYVRSAESHRFIYNLSGMPMLL